MDDDVVIRVEGVWKRYGLPLGPALRRMWRTALAGPDQSAADDDTDRDGPWSLRNVDLQVKRGQTLGIIGANGAGKSTLLKLLAGVTPATRGRVEVRGRVFPMIELNAGLHQELTGRENVRLLGAVMGLSRREILSKLPEIEAFTQLGDWLGRPVRKYSSGMLARLGFAVAMAVDTDVLLVDEVLAVGDIVFQRKCLREIHRFASRGGTVVLVSHWMDMIRSVCAEGLYLDAGAVVGRGDIQSVISEYVDAAHRGEKIEREKQGQAADEATADDAGIRITEVEVLASGSQQPNGEVASGEDVTLRIHYRASRRIEHPSFGVSVWTANGVRISTANTLFDGFAIGPLEGPGYCDCQLARLPLLPGVYFVRVGVYDAVTTWPYHRIGWDDEPVELVVKGGRRLSKNVALTPDHGIVHLQTAWSLDSTPEGTRRG